jgi:hypothetical protein
VSARVRAAVLLATALVAGHAGAQSFIAPPELWDRPRSGPVVMERLGQAVGAWLAQPGARLVVRHGAGQEALIQAEELRGWLIALAVEAERVSLRNDLRQGEPLRIEVTSDR